MVTNAMFVKNCSFVQGLTFFLLIPLVSVVFGSVLGFFCAVHYRFPRVGLFVYYALFLAYAVAEGYFTPAIFSYNFLYGYFPGLTYDEVLGISWTLVAFRIITLLAAILVLWFTVLILTNTLPGDSTLSKGISLARALSGSAHRFKSAMILLVCMIVWSFRGSIGFESTSGFIESRLGSRFVTEHFTIYYSSQSYDEDEIKWVGAEHEFRLKQIADAFSLPARGKIRSFIYPSADVKKRLIGTGTTNIAKPWSGQIHLTKQSLAGTLKHELTHVFAAPFGFPVIKASLSTGLTEGLAMAIEWEWGNRTLHEYAAAMRKFGAMPDIQPLMLLAGFASQSSSVSYVVCGSFCRFLIDRYGMRKMMQVYRSTDYERTYGRSLHQLIGEWYGFLDRIPVRDQDRDAIDVIFRRAPIFKKVCVRAIAEQNISARRKFDAREYKDAETLYHKSYQESRSYEALGGYLASALRSGDIKEVTVTLDSVVMVDPHPAQYLPLFLTIGDAFWSLGNTSKADELYGRLRHADLSIGLDESAAVRLVVLREFPAVEALRLYFLKDLPDTIRVTVLDSLEASHHLGWMVSYLKGRVLARIRHCQESLDLLNSFSLAPNDSLLEALRLRTMGYDLFRLRRFGESKSLFWTSLNYLSSQVAVNEVNNWVERCEWMEVRPDFAQP